MLFRGGPLGNLKKGVRRKLEDGIVAGKCTRELQSNMKRKFKKVIKKGKMNSAFAFAVAFASVFAFAFAFPFAFAFAFACAFVFTFPRGTAGFCSSGGNRWKI